jgi:hypothetical protein
LVVDAAALDELSARTSDRVVDREEGP